MGALCKLIDAVLFLLFLVVAIAAPLVDAQAALPESFFPQVLVDFKTWYSREYGDHLYTEKPYFFVGLVWLELLFQWPLALLNLYGILAAKSWFSTTCLIYGASFVTAIVAILAERLGSGKASDELLMMYFVFMGLGVLAVLRGLLPQSKKTTSTIGKRSAMSVKKRA